MSLKPPKKSDMGKSWMKPRRDKNILLRPEYHLIVTEGTETEPQYFEAIRNIINSQYSDKIQLDVHGAGDNTLSLLDKAMNPVLIYLRKRLSIMLFGRINVLNYGFYCILVFFNLIFIEMSIGQSYLNG